MFIDEVLTHLNQTGYGLPSKQLFGGSSAALPETDGPFIVMHQTGGFEFLEIHNETGAYQRPTAQLSVHHRSHTVASGICEALLKTLNLRNMLLGAKSLSAPVITRVGAVATVTVTAPHYLIAGQKVTISGAAQAEYNGEKVLTSAPTANTLTFAVAGTPATPATGVILVQFLGTFYQEIRPRQSAPIDLNLDAAKRARLAINIRAVKAPS